MEMYSYSESGKVNAIYNECVDSDVQYTVESLTQLIKEKVEIWQGACKEVVDRGELDMHQYNQLYELYKEASLWYMMVDPEAIDCTKYLNRGLAEAMVQDLIPEYIHNVYSPDSLEDCAIERSFISLHGQKTAYAANIMRDAFWDAKVDMMRWQVAEKLADYGYMN